MKQAAKRKKSPSSNSDGFHRTRKVIDAIERVFRSTHKREMTSDERRKFRLPPVEDGEHKSDST